MVCFKHEMFFFPKHSFSSKQNTNKWLFVAFLTWIYNFQTVAVKCQNNDMQIEKSFLLIPSKIDRSYRKKIDMDCSQSRCVYNKLKIVTIFLMYIYEISVGLKESI